jgi:hypothetical protein
MNGSALLRLSTNPSSPSSPHRYDANGMLLEPSLFIFVSKPCTTPKFLSPFFCVQIPEILNIVSDAHTVLV